LLRHAAEIARAVGDRSAGQKYFEQAAELSNAERVAEAAAQP
jgi:hypothetical protein